MEIFQGEVKQMDSVINRKKGHQQNFGSQLGLTEWGQTTPSMLHKRCATGNVC